MVEKDYNKKYKKWVQGDTFAIRIKNNEEYKDRYLILIKYENPEWDISTNVFSFRAKITKDNVLPKTKEEINALEYIQTRITLFRDRFLPYSGLIPFEELIRERSKVKFYPDENGYLNVYIFSIYFQRKYKEILEEFIYMGNFDLESPYHEYIPFDKHNCAGFYLLDILETRLINNYEDYNLKKSISYDEDNLKALNAWGIYTLPSAEEIAEILKENNIDITKGSRSDRETYVGGEEKNPGKIKKTSDKN